MAGSAREGRWNVPGHCDLYLHRCVGAPNRSIIAGTRARQAEHLHETETSFELMPGAFRGSGPWPRSALGSSSEADAIQLGSYCSGARLASSGERAMSSVASATSTRPTRPPRIAATSHDVVNCTQKAE